MLQERTPFWCPEYHDPVTKSPCYTVLRTCISGSFRPETIRLISALALQITVGQGTGPVSRQAVLVLQVRYNIVRALLFRVELIEYFRPVSERLASHLHNLLVTHFPMVCVQDMVFLLRAFSMPFKCLTLAALKGETPNSVLRWRLFGVIDDQHVHSVFARFDLDSQLFPQGRDHGFTARGVHS